jgi:hypothetical protein
MRIENKRRKYKQSERNEKKRNEMEWKVFGYIILTIVIFILILSFVHQRKKINYKEKIKSTQEQLIQQCKRIHPEDTIFILISSLDVDPSTIVSIFSQAYCPYRIYIGTIPTVLEQIKKWPFPFLPVQNLNAFINEHIRVIVPENDIPLCKTIHDYLFRNEKYYLILNHHNNAAVSFLPNWDLECIQELGMNWQLILTTSPTRIPATSSFNTNTTATTTIANPNIITAKSSENQNQQMLLSFDSIPFQMRPTRLMPQLFWSSQFSFSFSDVIRSVPFDPFFLEWNDLLYSARLWTHGYSFVAPLQSITFQETQTEGRRRYNNPFLTPEATTEAIQRLEVILQIRPMNTVHPKRLTNLDLFGLGTRRKLSDYEFYCHCEFRNKTVGIRANYGCSPEPSNDELLSKYGSTF